MRDEKQIRAIARAINETLSRDFENIKIVDIRILNDDEFFDDEDDFLRIEVVFESEPTDRHVFSKAVRHVRPRLSEIGEEAFPIFSFTMQDDAGSKRLESA